MVRATRPIYVGDERAADVRSYQGIVKRKVQKQNKNSARSGTPSLRRSSRTVGRRRRHPEERYASRWNERERSGERRAKDLEGAGQGVDTGRYEMPIGRYLVPILSPKRRVPR